MNKLKAFTILELVVTMAIMGIVATIAYSVAETSQMQFHSYENGQTTLAQISQLNSLLQQDTDRCTRMLKSQDGVTFIKPHDTTVYFFEPDFIARIQTGQSDTFTLLPEDFSASYDGKAQLLPGSLIDQVQFVAYLDESAFPFAAHKKYDARFLLQNELKE